MMDMHGQFAVILPAAGSGNRFGETGGVGDKLLADIGGLSVLQRSVDAFARRPDVSALVIVTSPVRLERYREHLAMAGTGVREKLLFVAGGRERWESVLFGLRALAGRDGELPPRYVAVHDAARPLVTGAVIEEAFATTREHGSALPCVAEPATLKRRGENGCVRETLDRRGLYQAQTPQCFELGKLLAGYEKLLFEGGGDGIPGLTDDAQVYERMGWAVRITTGTPLNIKITTGEDIAFARAVIASKTLPDEESQEQ